MEGLHGWPPSLNVQEPEHEQAQGVAEKREGQRKSGVSPERGGKQIGLIKGKIGRREGGSLLL